MARIVVHNYMTRSVGRFRATGGAQDHLDCGCGCGGKGNCNHSHDSKDYAKAELGIDVTYSKGSMGREMLETRHYDVPNITLDPRGRAPEQAFVAAELRRQPGHIDMVKGGWTAKKAEGYYKREQRDVSRHAV